jgi:hypothetical protein
MTNSFPILISDLVGFRLRPTDVELVNHYLKSKLLGNDDIVKDVIAEIDLCKFEPWDLPGTITPSLFCDKNATFFDNFILFSFCDDAVR